MTKKMLMAVACLGAAIGSAQTMNTLHVNLPVGAKVGNVYLPAGGYSIHELNNSVIEISSTDRNGVNTFATVNSIMAPNQKTADHNKVVLRRDDNGSGYQVQQIWLEGQDIGFELMAAE
jgi:hypothetical protein